MATKVQQHYTSSLNVSITRKGGIVTKVTTWTTGDPASTDRIVDESPKGIRLNYTPPKRRKR